MDTKRLYGIRGAWCTANNEEAMRRDVSAMVGGILKENSLDENDIVSIQFTVTNDLDAMNPAAALRKEGLCLHSALFCALEPFVKNSLPCTIRVLITAYLSKKPTHVYGGGAEVLRPDFAKKA